MSTDPETVRAYNLAAVEYDIHVADPSNSPLHEYYEKPAMHAELDVRGKDILNVGCGSGLDNEWCHEQGVGSITGIDLSPQLIEIAKSHFPDDNFSVMNMTKLGFQDSSFDIAYSSLAVHYLSDWVPALQEIHRVIRDNGRFIFSSNHPLETSLDYSVGEHSRIAHIGREIISATNSRQVFGDYMAAQNDGVKKVRGTFADTHSVIYYHRTFSRMMNDIQTAGFAIDKVIEPLPQEVMAQSDPELYKQLMNQPKFIIWVLQK